MSLALLLLACYKVYRKLWYAYFIAGSNSNFSAVIIMTVFCVKRLFVFFPSLMITTWIAYKKLICRMRLRAMFTKSNECVFFNHRGHRVMHRGHREYENYH